ncbi:MAG: hypothetical protein U0269_05585 [Polyangiales bacterium]
MTRGHNGSKRAVKRAIGNRPLPLGEGVIARVLEIEEREQLRLALLLAGYDGLGSLHGDGERVVIVSTESQARELDEALASIARYGVRFRVLADE